MLSIKLTQQLSVSHHQPMANHPKSDPNTLPKVVILHPPPVFLHLEPEFSRHFHFLKAYDSPLPLPEFLAGAGAAGATAMLVTSVGAPITGVGVLDHIPSVKCLVSTAAGVDYIDLEECRRRGIAVANGVGVSSEECADFGVGLLIDVLRKVSVANRFVRGGDWIQGDFPLGRRLSGKTIGIVGLGGIGSKIAKRLQAFGCHILYTSRKQKPSVPYTFYSDICELAANSDVLVLCCSLTEQTKHLINKEVLLALGKDGIIINIARGSVIDEKELVRFLVDGQIAGAGLDVFEHEPNVPKELFALDNVVLTHHQAPFTEDCFRDLYELVKGNLQAFFSNKPLLTPVL